MITVVLGRHDEGWDWGILDDERLVAISDNVYRTKAKAWDSVREILNADKVEIRVDRSFIGAE